MPKKRINVLITAAGSTHGINVIKALRGQKELEVFIIATDVDNLAAGFYLADRRYLVPRADDSGFTQAILKICHKEKISVILPTLSFELPFFAAQKGLFKDHGVFMAISDPETFQATHNKIEANKCFESLGMSIPKIYTKEEIANKQVKFPVMVKPIESSGSKGVTKANNWEELNFFSTYIKNNFIQEFAGGHEYCIDGICDFESRLIGASPRIRIETKGGLAVKSETVKDDDLVRSVGHIVKQFKIIGPFNVQCFKDGKSFKFIEINSRFPSGGLPLTVRAGLNMPLIALQLALGYKIKKPVIKTGLYMTRYWDAFIVKAVGNTYKIV